MKKGFYIAGYVTFLLFLLFVFSYKSNFIETFDQLMKNLMIGNDFIIFFHYFGELNFVEVLSFIVILILFLKKQYNKIFLVVSNVGVGFFINQVVKKFIKRPRPEIPDQLSTYSFPSAHAMLGLLYIFTLCYLMTENMQNRKLSYGIWVIGIFLVVFIGLSRVAESRHFASDVLAGWFLGFTWFTISVFILNKINKLN